MGGRTGCWWRTERKATIRIPAEILDATKRWGSLKTPSRPPPSRPCGGWKWSVHGNEIPVADTGPTFGAPVLSLIPPHYQTPSPNALCFRCLRRPRSRPLCPPPHPPRANICPVGRSRATRGDSSNLHRWSRSVEPYTGVWPTESLRPVRLHSTSPRRATKIEKLETKHDEHDGNYPHFPPRVHNSSLSALPHDGPPSGPWQPLLWGSVQWQGGLSPVSTKGHPSRLQPLRPPSR